MDLNFELHIRENYKDKRNQFHFFFLFCIHYFRPALKLFKRTCLISLCQWASCTCTGSYTHIALAVEVIMRPELQSLVSIESSWSSIMGASTSLDETTEGTASLVDTGDSRLMSVAVTTSPLTLLTSSVLELVD